VARTAPAELKAIIRDFRRDQIIDVARRLFGERGTTEVPMDEIATEAGVARSTLYVYFANRDELLRACLQRMHTLLLDAIVASWEHDLDPVARLRTLVRAMLERIDDNPAFFRLALATQGVSSPLGSTVGAELDLIGLDIAGLIRDVIEQGTVAGQFRLPDADRATTFVGQQVYGAMSVRAGDPAPDPIDEATDQLCGFMLHGLPATYGTQNHTSLQVPDMGKAVEALEARPAYKTYLTYQKPLEVHVGVNGKRQVNLYDPDGTRVELMEPFTADGKPVPSSTAPPPPPAHD